MEPALPPLPAKPDQPIQKYQKQLLSDTVNVELPTGIEDAKIHIINELRDSKPLLQGLYESSDLAERIYKSQKEHAEKNIERAKSLLEELRTLEAAREDSGTALSSAKKLEQEWFGIEQQMYRSLQPFSIHELKGKLEYATKESESLSDVLVASFMEGSSTDSIPDFLKAYRQERTTFHLRSEKLQRWNEDRVN